MPACRWKYENFIARKGVESPIASKFLMDINNKRPEIGFNFLEDFFPDGSV